MKILVGIHAAHDGVRDVLVVHMLFLSAWCRGSPRQARGQDSNVTGVRPFSGHTAPAR